MNLSEMEQLQAWKEANPVKPRSTPPDWPQINWHIVGGVCFGLFIWYVGYALLDYALHH